MLVSLSKLGVIGVCVLVYHSALIDIVDTSARGCAVRTERQGRIPAKTDRDRVQHNDETIAPLGFSRSIEWNPVIRKVGAVTCTISYVG